LACQDEFLANNPLDVKENDEQALDFALHLCRLIGSARVSVALFSRFAQNLTLFLCRILHEIASGHKNSTSIQMREIVYTDSQDMLVL
jgi:hypothetical protein